MLAKVRKALRAAGLDPASARGDNDEPHGGAYVSNIANRAAMRGERLAVIEILESIA